MLAGGERRRGEGRPFRDQGRAANSLAAEDGLGLQGGKRAMAAAGQQAMTQKQLNEALWDACDRDNNLPRAVELLDRGADPNVLKHGSNALHEAAINGRL